MFVEWVERDDWSGSDWLAHRDARDLRSFSMDVSLDDVAAVFRLVREVCDLWDDPNAWRQHLLHGACRLVDGHVGMMLADYQPGHGFFGNLEVISVVGLPAQMQPLVQPAISQANYRQIQDVTDNLMPGM